MLVCDYYRRMSNDASEAWTLLFRLFVSQRGRVPQVASEFELSPMQAHVLRLLEPEEPLPMRTLARKLCCDASNVTGIVDRLEELGLVRRAAAPDKPALLQPVDDGGDVGGGAAQLACQRPHRQRLFGL